MQGFITEADLAQADKVFPGIERFFATLVNKPATFLELLAEFEHWTTNPLPLTRCMSPSWRRARRRRWSVRHGD